MPVISSLITHFFTQRIIRKNIRHALLYVMMQFTFKPPMEVDYGSGLTECAFNAIAVNVHSVCTQKIELIIIISFQCALFS